MWMGRRELSPLLLGVVLVNRREDSVFRQLNCHLERADGVHVRGDNRDTVQLKVTT